MEALTTILPIIIYFLLIILLVIVIILGIKIIIAIDKVNEAIDDIRNKVDSLNGMFKIVNFASDKLNYLGVRAVDSIMAFINKIFGLSGKDDTDYE